MGYDPYSRVLALRAQAALTTLGTTSGGGQVGVDDGSSGAKFTTVQAFVAKLMSTSGAALSGFVQPYTGTNAAVAGSVQTKLQEVVSVKDFGAAGDGTTDDTAAIQKAINAIITGDGAGHLFFPAGTYKITAALNIGFATGWRIRGSSRGQATILQATSNTPILKVNNDYTHGWEITDLYFRWSTAQPAANTNAMAIVLGGTTANGGLYNFQIRRCNFANGFRGISTASGTGGGPIWGVKIAECIFWNTMSGASVYLLPNPAVGQPNITIEDCMIDASSAYEPVIRIGYCDSLMMRNVEMLGGSSANLARLVLLTTCANVVMMSCRSEAFIAGTVTGNPQIWTFSQTSATLIGCSVSNIIGTTSNPLVIKGDTGSRLTLFGLSIQSALTTGYATAYMADEVTFIDKVTLTGNVTENTQTYLGVAFAPKLNVANWLGDFAEWPGDADKTLVSTCGRMQYYDKTLTANRQIKLPTDSGMRVGMEIEVIRKTTTPGNYTLSVTDLLSGQNFVIPANTNGYVAYRFEGGRYMMLRSGTMS